MYGVRHRPHPAASTTSSAPIVGIHRNRRLAKVASHWVEGGVSLRGARGKMHPSISSGGFKQMG